MTQQLQMDPGGGGGWWRGLDVRRAVSERLFASLSDSRHARLNVTLAKNIVFLSEIFFFSYCLLYLCVCVFYKYKCNLVEKNPPSGLEEVQLLTDLGESLSRSDLISRAACQLSFHSLARTDSPNRPVPLCPRT